jgi:hypothetical protein
MVERRILPPPNFCIFLVQAFCLFQENIDSDSLSIPSSKKTADNMRKDMPISANMP